MTHSIFLGRSLLSSDISPNIVVKGCVCVKRKSLQLQWFKVLWGHGKADARVSPSFTSSCVTLGSTCCALSILVYKENPKDYCGHEMRAWAVAEEEESEFRFLHFASAALTRDPTLKWSGSEVELANYRALGDPRCTNEDQQAGGPTLQRGWGYLYSIKAAITTRISRMLRSPPMT